jgi:hypothetical protein
MKYFLSLLSLLFVGFAFSQTEEQLIKDGKWSTLVSNTTSTFYYDRSKVKNFDNVIHTYVFSHNKEKNTRMGPWEFKARCATKEFLLGSSNNWSVPKENTFAMISLEKLCGLKLIETEPPYKYVGLIKQDNIFYFLYSSMQPYKMTDSPEKTILERGLISISHPPKDLTKFSHLIMNCSTKKLTLSPPTAVENFNFKADENYLNVESPNLIIEDYINEKCLLNDLPVLPTKLISNTASTNKRVESLNFEEASEKCVEIGFTRKTEAFGKCVLQLTN